MGKRKIIVKQSVAFAIAQVSWFIESKGLVNTAENYINRIYNFFETIADDKRSHPVCRDKQRAIVEINVFLSKENIRLYLLKPI